jgi:spore germination protein
MGVARRCRVLVVVALALGLSAAPAWAADVSPSDPAVSAWLPFWTASESTDAVTRNSDVISVASPFWYEARERSLTAYPGAGSSDQVRRLRRAGLRVIPTVASRLTPREMAALGSDPRARGRHVRMLLDLAARHRYHGLDLDYEHMALTTSSRQAARTRAAFSALVRSLCAGLREDGRRCIVTVMPRTSDAPTVWRDELIPAVYDYAALGRHAHRVRVMAYDQHAPNTRHGPIAAIDWAERIVRYAVQKAPRRKLELGIPLYGRDWGGGTVRSLTYEQARALRRRTGAERIWHSDSASPHFHYRSGGRPHDVWYSDASSSARRYGLAQRYGLRGTAFWAPGAEDSRTWDRIEALRR